MQIIYDEHKFINNPRIKLHLKNEISTKTINQMIQYYSIIQGFIQPYIYGLGICYWH